jgi:beta-lactamase regulating signal transducer with metallopeptidase domain/Leucine-rich repeat (LRR) protein
MTTLLGSLTELPTAVIVLLKMTVLLGAGWILHFALFRRNPRWRVLVWRGVMAGMVLLPVGELVLPNLQIAVAPPPVVEELAAQAVTYEPVTDVQSDASVAPVEAEMVYSPQAAMIGDLYMEWLCQVLLWTGWGLIGLILAVRVICVTRRVRRLVRSSEPAPEQIRVLMKKVADDLHCNARVDLRVTDGLGSPFLAGVIRPVLVLPETMTDERHAGELPAVFAHELAHLQAHDLIWIVVGKWLAVLWWFHPLAWTARAAYVGACEEVCDAVAADYVGGAQSYSRTLARAALELVVDAPAPGGIPMIRTSDITRRLRNLKRGIKAAALARPWVGAAALMGCLTLMVLGCLRLVRANGPARAEQISTNEQQPAPSLYTFGPVIERWINDDDARENFSIDFDTGRVSDRYPARLVSGMLTSIGLDIDAFVDVSGKPKNIICADMIVMAADHVWDGDPSAIVKELERGRPGSPVYMSAEGELPKSFIFKTYQWTIGRPKTEMHERGMGVLQILEMSDQVEPRGLRIRYKLIKWEKAREGQPSPETMVDARPASAAAKPPGVTLSPSEVAEIIQELEDSLAHSLPERPRISFRYTLSCATDYDYRDGTTAGSFEESDEGWYHKDGERFDFGSTGLKDSPEGEVPIRRKWVISDGFEVHYAYGTSAGYPVKPPRTAFCRILPADKENFTRAVRASLHYKSFLSGAIPGDGGATIVDILRGCPNVELGRETETIAGHQTRVLRADTENGEYTVWLDHESGFLPRQVRVHKEGDDLLWGKPVSYIPEDRVRAGLRVLPETKSWTLVLNSVKVATIGEHHAITGFSLEKRSEYITGGHNRLRMRVDVTDVELTPNFDNTDAFVMDLPDGTLIFDLDNRGKELSWHEGQVVMKEGSKLVPYKRTQVSGGHPADPQAAAESPGVTATDNSEGRTVRFPEDRSLGKLKMRDDGAYTHWDAGWEPLGEARGTVRVPEGKQLRLEIFYETAPDLSSLTDLEPDDLYHVMLWHTAARDDDLRHLTHLTGLQGLGLERAHITDNALKHLSAMTSLKHLDLSGTPIGDVGLASIKEITWLESLKLSDTRISDAGLAHVANLRSLRSINLRGTDTSDEGLAHLKNLTSLERLSLSETDTSYRGLPHLSKLTAMEHLSLKGTKLSDRGLANLKELRSLKYLRMDDTPIGDRGMVHLRNLKSLQALYLPTNRISNRGLAQLTGLPVLKELHLASQERVTDAGLAHVAKIQSLEQLSIGGPRITDTGMSHLAKLTGLENLSLSNCRVSDAGLAELRPLKSLRSLYLHRTRVTGPGLAHLKGFPLLNRLRLSYFELGEHRLKHLADLTGLEQLMLGNLEINDEDMVHLGRLKRLKSLWFSFGTVSDAGFAHLAGLTELSNIVALGCNLTDESLGYLSNKDNLWSVQITGDFTDAGLRHLEALPSLSFLRLTGNFSDEALARLEKETPSLQNLDVVEERR